MGAPAANHSALMPDRATPATCNCISALHVAAILFYLLYERNNLVSAMLSGRRKRIAGKPGAMQPAPAWRLWTGVALATLVVWLVVR